MILRTRANVRAVTGVDCDGEAWAVVVNGMATLYTDFRYIPMAHRVAPALRVRDVKRFEADLRRAFGGRGASGRRVGFEKAISVADFEKLKKVLPRVKFTDATRALQRRRAVKSEEEIAKMRERRMRKIVRNLPPRLRKFALALKHVLEDVPGPQDLQREKIMKRLRIGDRMYRKYISSVPKYLV